jgi:hypothetical protein
MPKLARFRRESRSFVRKTSLVFIIDLVVHEVKGIS